MEDILTRYEKVTTLRAQLLVDWETPKRWGIIREYYRMVEPLLLEGYRLSPYELGLGEKLTPIEYALWSDIRYMGLPFYMQYPVGRRFVDFGDPRMKIAIEADSAKWHTPEKDLIRDRELRNEGWRVFRIGGSDCFKRDALFEVAHAYGVNLEVDEEEYA